MGGSYIALLTGFYVDNGPFLPLWDRLPHLTYWLLPTAIGVPLIWRCTGSPIRRIRQPDRAGHPINVLHACPEKYRMTMSYRTANIDP
jgi:hypothetical protein